MANRKRNIKAVDKVVRKSLNATGNTLGKVATHHQPYINERMEVMSTLASVGVNGALGSYQIRRLLWNMPWYEMDRGNYFVDLTKDIVILVIEIIWNIVSPFIYMLVGLLIYMAIYLAMIFLFFYLLFCMF